MAAFNVAVQPGDLEQEVEQLQLLQACEFSHLSLAESLWNDEFGAPDDPRLLGFREKATGDKTLASTLWKAFKAEWFELACTQNPKYEALRKHVLELKGAPATVVVSSLSAGIAACIGLTAGILAPFVAILLHGMLTVGNGVICRTILEEQQNSHVNSQGTAQQTTDPGSKAQQ